MVQKRQEPYKGGSSLGWCWHDHWHGPPVCSTGGPQSATGGLPGKVAELHQSLAQKLLPPLTPGHWLRAGGTLAVKEKFTSEWSTRDCTVHTKTYVNFEYQDGALTW